MKLKRYLSFLYLNSTSTHFSIPKFAYLGGFILLFQFLFSNPVFAQCGGGFGAPIFLETFGQGTTYGPALTVDKGFGATNYSTGATTYIYWQPGYPGLCNDGQYAILNNSHQGDNGSFGWISKTDHTGNTNGKMLVVNASYAPGTFYEREVTSLCKNTNFLFSAWFLDLNGPNCGGYTKVLPINIKFIVSDSLGNILDSASTGNIRPNSSYTQGWQNFSFPINTGNYTTVYVQLVNNAPGGCGNDLAIDDISFQPCGPVITLNGPTGTVCTGNTISFTSKVSAGYSSNYYQWQASTNGGITWANISGANASKYTINSVAANQNGEEFRLLVAGSAENVSNANCSVVSAPFILNISTPVITTTNPGTQCNSGGKLNLVPFASPAGGTFSGNGVTGNFLNLASVKQGIDTILYNYTSPTTGCSGTGVFYVTVQANPTVKVSVTGASAACYGSTILLTASGTGTIQWYQNGKAITGATSSNYYASSTGTYKAVVTSAGGCLGQDSTLVTIYPNPNLQIKGSSATICQGSTTTLTSSLPGSSYKWTLNHTKTLANTTNTYIASTAGVYTLTIKDINGCIDSASYTVSVNPLPIISPVQINGDTVICSGGNVSFGVFNLPNYVSYQWYDDGKVIPGATTNAYTALDSGTYYLQVTDINGCVGKSRNLHVILAPAPAIPVISSSLPTSVCFPSVVTLSMTPVPGLVYQWRNNGVALPNSNSPTYKATTTGTYTVLVENSSGCTALSNAIAVTIYPKPTANITYSTLTTCNGVPILLTANPSPTAGDTYQWYKNGSVVAGQTSATYTTTGTGTYFYVITNANGCKDTASSVNVTIYPTSAVTIIADGPTTFCNPGVVTLESTSTFSSYQWYLSGVPITGATGPTYDATVAGSYTLQVVDVNGCPSSSGSINVIVNPQTIPVLNPGGPTSFCSGGAVVLTANAASGGGTYAWFVNGKSIPASLIVGQTYTATASGTYTVTYTNVSGCTASSLPVVVKVNPLPTPAIQVGGTVQLCPSGSGNPPSMFVLHLVKPVIGSTYTWTLTDTLTHGQTIVSTGPNDSTYTVPTSGTVEGYYKVQETSSFGCIGNSDSVLIRLYKPPISGLTGLTICQGDTDLLYSPPGKTFQWYYSPSGTPGTFVQASTYAGLGGLADNQKIYKAIDSGYYYVYVFDGNCYGTSSTIHVQGLKPIQASIPAVAPFCSGTTTALNVNITYPAPDPSGLNYHYQWYFLKSGGTTFDSIPGGIFNQIGADSSGTYKVIVTSKVSGKYCPGFATAITVVNTPVKPLISAGIKDSLCAGKTDTLKITNQSSLINAPGAPTYQWYRNTVALAGHTADTLINTLSGQYFVQVIDGNGCKLNSDTLTITSVALPKPTITSTGPTRFCKGGTDTIYTASTAGSTYQWYRKLTTASAYSLINAASGGTSNKLAIIDSGTYKIVVTNSTGCTGQDSIQIRVDSVPSVVLPNALSICPGTFQTLKVSTKGTVQWSYNSQTNIISTVDSIQANLAGTYYVKVRNTSNSLCYTLDSVKVSLYAQPVIQFQSLASCQKSDSINFVNKSTISDGTTLNYRWNFGDPASGVLDTSSNKNPQHVYKTAGTYLIKLIGTSVHGCVDSTQFSFVFSGTNPSSKFMINPSAFYCAGQNLTIRDTSTIQVGTIKHYHWDIFNGQGKPANVVADTLKDIQIQFPDTAVSILYRIRETVTSSAGCADTSSQNILITGSPQVRFINPSPIVCIGSGLDSLKGGSPLNGTGGGIGTYSGVGVTAGIFNPKIAGVGKHAITYTFINAGSGCSGSAIDTIQVLSQPAVTFLTKGATISPCDTLVKLVVKGTGATQYAWFRNDTIIGNADSSYYMATLGGKYTARLYNAQGCYIDTSLSFGLNPHPQANYTVGSICQNLTVYFNNLSHISDNSALTYQWNFGEPASGSNTSTAKNANHQYSSIGNYTVMLVAGSKTGCLDTFKTLIRVNSVDSNANFTIKSNMPYCTNEPLIFEDSSSLPTGKLINQYTWKFYNSAGTLIKQDTGTVVLEKFPIVGNLPQTFSAQEFLNTGDSCLTASPIKKFIVNPITPVTYTREAPFELCIYNPAFNLTGGATVPAGQKGTGTYTGNGVTGGNTFTAEKAGVGDNIISYVFTNQYGCTSTASTDYYVNDTIALTGSTITAQENNTVTLNGIGALPFTFGPDGISSINADSLKWFWSPSTGLNSATDTTPSFIAKNNITYSLTVTSPRGCISHAAFIVNVNLNLFVPNSFSPNGDGIHDTWYVQGLELYPNVEIFIFNRWGEQLWYNKGGNSEFNGYYNGRPLPAGTYYYLIKFNKGNDKPMSGPLTIIY